MALDTWEIEVRHDGLNKFRIIRGKSKYEVEEKARAQIAIWGEMWETKIQNETRKAEIEENKEKALNQTAEYKEKFRNIRNVLNNALENESTFSWDLLKDNSHFEKSQPSEKDKPPKPSPPPQPQLLEIPNEPDDKDPKYQPTFSFLDTIIRSRKKRKLKEARNLFEKDYSYWEKEKEEITIKNKQRREIHEEEVTRIYQRYHDEVKKWEYNYNKKLKEWHVEKRNLLKEQKKHNENIEKKKNDYFNKSSYAIVEFCILILSNSKYPQGFSKDFKINYNPLNKILIIDYQLPSIEVTPKIKEVKYIQSRNEFKEVLHPIDTINKLYDSLLYQITLKSIYEILTQDQAESIDSIVFNGWVKSIDKGTGHNINACILSIQTSRQEFLSLNFKNIEPKICFKKLKGVGSSKLHSLAPIAPLLKSDDKDNRFISSYGVVDDLSEYYNLAVMEWTDFEHLIRELFEKEFAASGGEVKVTRASRDGGVDAIAFDPDPLRGGKIVIQAKRYTNIVSVAAVRDLYGTIVNEGATKGILVTTSDYGPDAYEFARGKPITLLNGGNLLHLLEKHGHKVKIDLKEAKEILAKRENTK